MKHPDTQFVQSVLKAVLAKRRLAEWKVVDIRYVFFPSHYEVQFEKEGLRKGVSIVTEFFDDVASNDSLINRRKIKNVVRQTLTPDDPDDN